MSNMQYVLVVQRGSFVFLVMSRSRERFCGSLANCNVTLRTSHTAMYHKLSHTFR